MRVPLAPLLCFGAAWLLADWTIVRRLEWRSLDWRTVFRVRYQPPPDPRISIILYEDTTEADLAPWPPDRGVHGDMIKFLTLAGPKVIAWDVILDATREGDGDEAMGAAAAMAARAGTRVITGAVSDPYPVEGDAAGRGLTRALSKVRGDRAGLVGDTHALLPFPALRATSWYGFVDTPPGGDGVRREIPLVVRVGDEVYPSLALQTLMAFFDVEPDGVRVELGDAVYLPTAVRGELRLPVDAAGRFLLNYRYDQAKVGLDFAAMNYVEALFKLNERFVQGTGEPEMPALAGGIVFIGQSVVGKADAGPTQRSPLSPLVLVHTNLVNNVLANDLARRAPPGAVWLGGVVWGYVGLAIGLRRSVWAMAVFGVASATCYVAACFGAWVQWSLWLPLWWPVLGFGALQFVVIGGRVRREQRAREQVKKMFGAYLSPELLAKMMKDGRSIAAVSSERRPVTVLFSDLRDFTSLTERMGDEELVAQLNEYLAAMVECIHREGGTLHKFIGDAVMAVWGDLESEGIENDARRAARAALAMQRTLRGLNERWRAVGKPELRMGIGLNHGVVLIGNIGSPRRMEFSAIGDAVNLASRLESLNKEQGTEVLVGETLRRLLGERFETRACGALQVKGKAAAVEVFELVEEKRLSEQPFCPN